MAARVLSIYWTVSSYCSDAIPKNKISIIYNCANREDVAALRNGASFEKDVYSEASHKEDTVV